MKKFITALLLAISPMTALAAPLPAATVSNKLSYKLFSEIIAKHKGENVFISPYSIFSALNMAYAGSAGATKTEFETLYAWPPAADLNSEYLLLNQSLQSDRGPNRLLNANALWVDKHINLVPEYLALTKANYGAGANPADFSNAAEAAKIINDWVAANTENKIPKILSADNLIGAKLVLTNAIYFYGSWLQAFDKSQTRDDGFGFERTAIKVRVMHGFKRRLQYFQSDSAQLAELPYKDSSLAMLIVLPYQQTSAALEKTLADLPQLVNAFDTGATNVEVNQLALPKFKFTGGIIDLVEPLKKIGLNLPFNSAADFSGITKDTNLIISNILHKAVIEVNEEGTEAAAATAVTMVKGSAMTKEKPAINFIVDHPFIFLIRDNKTGLILFSGLIFYPTE